MINREKGNLIENLGQISSIMKTKAMVYGKSNVGRFLLKCSEAISVEIRALEGFMKDVDLAISTQNKKIAELNNQINEIKKTKCWRWTSIFRLFSFKKAMNKV